MDATPDDSVWPFGSSTTTTNFDSKEACEAAGKSRDQAIDLRWHSFAVLRTCSRPRNSVTSVVTLPEPLPRLWPVSG
jgi:hypothetical protein